MVPEERRKRAIYITPLIRSSICTMKRMIGRAPLVLSHWRTLNRPIIWSFVQSYRIFLQYSLAFSHIEVRYIAKFIAFTSQNGRSESCKLRRSNFSYAIILPTVYKPYLIILVARIIVFCCVCSCGNCEKGLKYTPALSCSTEASTPFTKSLLLIAIIFNKNDTSQLAQNLPINKLVLFQNR